MKIADVLKLSLSGYSADQIKELKAMESDAPEIIDIAKNGKGFDEVKELYTFSKDLLSEDKPDDGKKHEEDTDKRDPATPDEPKKDEDLKAENEKLKKTIEDLQKENKLKDLSGDEPNEIDELNSVISSFM